MEEEIVLFKEKAFIPLPSTITDKEKDEDHASRRQGKNQQKRV